MKDDPFRWINMLTGYRLVQSVDFEINNTPTTSCPHVYCPDMTLSSYTCRIMVALHLYQSLSV
jgi:hypothetical protein